MLFEESRILLLEKPFGLVFSSLDCYIVGNHVTFIFSARISKLRPQLHSVFLYLRTQLLDLQTPYL